MDQQKLERLTARLGQDAAARVDVERVAEGVVRRLRTEQQPDAGGWRRLLAAAAAVAALVAGTVVWRGVDGPPSGAVAATPVPLDGVTPAVLAEVLDSLQMDGVAVGYRSPTLEDLDERQLRELLAIMEG